MEEFLETRTFKRGQVVWASWHTFAQGAEKMPAAFSTRIRKLGELGVPMSEEERPGQAGIDVEYTVQHVFELGVALKCLDIGLKQSEVAFFITHARQDLRRQYSRIMANPPSPGQNILAKDRPDSPRRVVLSGDSEKQLGDPNRHYQADASYFMSFRSVELRELWGKRISKREPFFFAPKYHRGLASLASEMERLADYINDDIRIVLELSSLAVRVTHLLKQAPQMPRGRQ